MTAEQIAQQHEHELYALLDSEVKKAEAKQKTLDEKAARRREVAAAKKTLAQRQAEEKAANIAAEAAQKAADAGKQLANQQGGRDLWRNVMGSAQLQVKVRYSPYSHTQLTDWKGKTMLRGLSGTSEAQRQAARTSSKCSHRIQTLSRMCSNWRMLWSSGSHRYRSPSLLNPVRLPAFTVRYGNWRKWLL